MVEATDGALRKRVAGAELDREAPGPQEVAASWARRLGNLLRVLCDRCLATPTSARGPCPSRKAEIMPSIPDPLLRR